MVGIVENGPVIGAYPKYEKKSGLAVMLCIKSTIAKMANASVKWVLNFKKFSKYWDKRIINKKEFASVKKICAFRYKASRIGK